LLSQRAKCQRVVRDDQRNHMNQYSNRRIDAPTLSHE